MRLGALTGLTSGQRAELRRRVAEHLGAETIRRPGGRPSALCLEGSVDLVCVLLRTNLTQDQAASIFDVSPSTASRRWDGTGFAMCSPTPSTLSCPRCAR